MNSVLEIAEKDLQTNFVSLDIMLHDVYACFFVSLPCRQIATVLRRHGATLDLLCSYPSQQVFMFGQKRELAEEDYLRSTASNPLISPLMLSIIHHDFNLTRQLIQLGASVNFADLEGRTPLMVAVYEVSLLDLLC